MRVLVALAGKNVELAAPGLAQIAAEHELIVSHGIGPQAGPLALRNALPGRDLVTVLTEVVVAADDPALGRPAKPSGPGGKRLLPSPEPRAIVALRSLRLLIDAGVIVVCAGGGIPIVVEGDGSMRGVEAVVDKDLTAALLARRLDVDLLMMLTDVDAVRLGWGSDSEVALDGTSPVDLRAHNFETGSIGPKVEAACRFVEASGRRAAIGALTDAVAIVRGEAGTQVALPAPA